MKRLLLLLGIMLAFVLAWQHLNEIPLAVVGQPSSTGVLQQQKEAPFFANLRNATGIALQVDYKPLEAVGFKDDHQLQMLKDGVFDLVSLRFLQNSEAEPALLGIDLPGLSPDYHTAHKVSTAYAQTVDHYLQDKFKAKLLGVWTFGPQEFFCARPLQRLQDIRGRKVRVGSNSLADFITELGGVPVAIPFDDTRNALALGLVDCAITSATSANSAGWVTSAPYNFQMVVHFGLNGYAISLKKWNALSAQEQQRLSAAFDKYLADLWLFSQKLRDDAHLCNTGGACLYGNAYKGFNTPPAAQDIGLLRAITLRKVLPTWGTKCDVEHRGCMDLWQEKLAAILEQR